jgi:hypothetical protein
MTSDMPLRHSYNLARLGIAGDEVFLVADAQQRAEIARWSGLLSVEKFEAGIGIQKLGLNRFGLDFRLLADVTQSCVVTLEPVLSHMERSFHRELQFAGTLRHKPASEEPAAELLLDGEEDEGPEEIQSLHYDMALPVLEEFALSLDPYPRCPGVEFSPPADALERPESPFAVLKALK